jgi:NarL family two-component system sensor histidine kinase LiaS
MSRTRPLRWYQQLRWKLPATYLLLAVAPLIPIIVFAVYDYLAYDTTYAPAAFLPIAEAKAPSAASLLAAPPVSAPGAAVLLEDLNDDLLTFRRGDPRYSLANFSSPSVISAIVDRAGSVVAVAPAGRLPVGAQVAGEGARLVEAALRGEIDPASLSALAADGTRLGAVPARDADGSVVGALFTRVYAPYSAYQHAQRLLGILLGPFSTYLVLAIVFAVVFGFLVARSLVARFERMSAAAARWGRGDFSVAVDDRSTDEIGQLAARLNAMASELQGVVELRQELATLEERNRLARDLHDAVKQQVFALAMQIGAAQAMLDGDRAGLESRLADAGKLARSVQHELVAMIRELQPPSRAGKPFAEVVRGYVADWARQGGIAAEVRLDRAEPLPPAVENAFFRVLQEALANVLRHSGATRVVVELSDDGPGRAVFSITDDGVGLGPAGRAVGMGLGNMRERAEELPGGRFSAGSANGRGTRIEVACDTNGTPQGS